MTTYEKRRTYKRKKAREYYWKNPSKYRKLALRRRRRNPQKARASFRKYYYDNLETMRAKARSYQEKTNQRRKWDAANPEKSKMIKRLGMARRRSSGHLKKADWETILLRYKHSCGFCRRSNIPLEMDHIVPVSRGGLTVPENIQPLCRSCNSHKKTNIMAIEPSGQLRFPSMLG